MKYQIVLCFLFAFQAATQADLITTRNEVYDPILYSCNFENDTCQMTVEPAPSGFTWLRFHGSTPSENTGPDYDHTTLTPEGYYMYTEATDFQPGDIAKLRLPSLTREPKGAICLTFWYHMYGQHIGTLNVTQNDSVLFSISFNQSYNWFQQNVTIKHPSAGSIVFVGVRGGYDIGQPYGDIAIDDVVIYDEPCELELTTEETTTMAATSATTEFITTPITTTEAITSKNMTLPQTSAIPNDSTVATNASMLPTEPVTNTTQPATTATPLAVTSFQVNQKNNFTAEVTDDSVRVSRGSLTTVEVTTKSTISNATTVESQTNSTEKNVTTGIQPIRTFSTDNSFMTTVAASKNTLYTYNVSKIASPAEVVMTDANSTVSTIKPDSISSNNTEMNTSSSNFTLPPKYDSLQSTSGMLMDPQASSSKKIWNLTEQNLILLLAFLGAFILILILVVAVLACCLCVTRRRYNVARSANVYNSNTTLDRDSLNENQRVATVKSDIDYM